MEQIIYRQAKLSDAQALFNLSVDFHKFYADLSGNNEEFFFDGWERSFKEEIKDSLEDKDGAVFVADNSGSLIGYVYLYHSTKGWYCLVNELFVLKEYRNKKVGEKLLEEALGWCKQFKCPTRVEVFDWNDRAVNFYLKNGFKKTSVVLEKD